MVMGHQAVWLSLVLFSWVWIKHAFAAGATTVTYNVSVRTGTDEHADTRANVWIQFFGSTGNTEEIPLSIYQAVSCHEELFWLGQTDVFIFEATHVGEIDRIALGRDNFGGGAGWFVDRVDIFVATLSRLYMFTVNAFINGQEVPNTEVQTVDTCFGSYWQETVRRTVIPHEDYQCDRDKGICSPDTFVVLTQSEAENLALCRCNEFNFVGFFFGAHPDQMISRGWVFDANYCHYFSLKYSGWIFDTNAAVRKDFDGYSLNCWPKDNFPCIGDYHLCKMTCGAPSVAFASGSAYLPILCSNSSPSAWVCDSPSLSTSAATPDDTAASPDTTPAATDATTTPTDATTASTDATTTSNDATTASTVAVTVSTDATIVTDAATSTVDAATSTNDAATATGATTASSDSNGAATASTVAVTVSTDATIVTDAATSTVDAATSTNDAATATGATTASSDSNGAATASTVAVTVSTDATIVTDAATSTNDAATSTVDAATSTNDAATSTGATTASSDSNGAATFTDTTTPAETTSADFTTTAEGTMPTEAIISTDATRSADGTTSAAVTAPADATSSAEATFITMITTATNSFESQTATTAGSAPSSTSGNTPSSLTTTSVSTTPTTSPATSTTTSVSTTPTTSPATFRDSAFGRCTCQFPRQFRQNLAQVFGNQTMGEIMSQLSEGLQKELTLNKSVLSSTINKKVSKPDERVSSTSVGYLAVGILSGVLMLLPLSDLGHFRQFCRKGNTPKIES